MTRYSGQDLPRDAKIALLANDALGNFAIGTVLAQSFRQDLPSATLDYYGGERTREVEEASLGGLFDWRISALCDNFTSAVKRGQERADAIGGYDLVMNIEMGLGLKSLATQLESVYVCGPCIDISGRCELPFENGPRGDLWRDRRWVSKDITERFPFLRSPFIGEIFHQLAYRSGDLPGYKFPQAEPGIPIPAVLISTGASLPEKLWPIDKWRKLLQLLKTEVGLLGAAPRRQAEFYHTSETEDTLVADALVTDLRGKLTLPEVVGSLSQARAVITIDNGILHFAAANKVPTVGLYRRDIVRLWAPPNPSLITLVPEAGDVEEIDVQTVYEAFNSLDACLP